MLQIQMKRIQEEKKILNVKKNRKREFKIQIKKNLKNEKQRFDLTRPRTPNGLGLNNGINTAQ